MTGFQSVINNQPAPAEAGDFCGANPRASIVGAPAAYVAPEGGLIVGNFAWVDPSDGSVTQYYRPGTQVVMLKRNNNAVITAFLGEAVYSVNKGLPLDIFDQGDFWAKFAAGATPGQRVWADPGTGAPVAGGATAPQGDAYTASAGFAGTAVQGAAFSIAITANVATVSLLTAGWVDTGSVVTSSSIPGGQALGARLTGSPGGIGTFTMVHANFSIETATAANDVVTVSAVTRGALQIGSVVDSAGADVTVEAFISPAVGGVGSYTVSGPDAYVASGAVVADTDVLTVTAVSSGVIRIGDPVSAPPADSGTLITEQLTGTPGGIGTYRLNISQNFASGAVTSSAVATPWRVNSVAANNELAKISTWG